MNFIIKTALLEDRTSINICPLTPIKNYFLFLTQNKHRLKKEVKPYESETDKKSQVSKMFNYIAPYYDLLNRTLSLGIDVSWRKKLITTISSNQPEKLLDIATGTADVAIMMAERIPSAKEIIGSDISVEMLNIGKKKVDKKKLSTKIRLEEGDSENLPYKDNTFDAVTVAFGVRNFATPLKGLKEINRVLKPGGILSVLEFSKPKVFPFKQFYNFYFRNVLPVVGRVTSKDPKAYTYLYESVQAFPDRENFMSLLKEAGFEPQKFQELTLGICCIYPGLKK